MEIKNLPQKIYKGHGFFKRTKKERKFAKKKVLENTLSAIEKRIANKTQEFDAKLDKWSKIKEKKIKEI